ncbi:MAG: YqgE/AlgH family protein [Bacteroidales bacterium]|nr:YqgE/AlgH family protein [Bacteroidales bacterium]MCF8387914.1 YqgE/AlgH family protein [Bacteroidales bacterium]MCF8396970.1 YqgE/AlgH family protein [Bacteroidales bacterium]
MSDINDMITIKTNNIAPEKGKLLISEPFLLDYYFKRSVVLLAEHNEEGSFGIIMNKPLDTSFNEVVKDFPEFDTNIFLGGPVKNDSLFFIHTMGDNIDNSAEIMDGLYWGGDIEQVKEMITLKLIKPSDIRFYIGYSGWGANQLAGELKRNSWVVSGMPARELLNIDPVALWKKSLNKLGDTYAYWPNFPADPASN